MKYYLRYVRLNMGGYNDKGSYWGIGKPLYSYWNDESTNWPRYIRAADRSDAKEQILQYDPQATFFDGEPK